MAAAPIIALALGTSVVVGVWRRVSYNLRSHARADKFERELRAARNQMTMETPWRAATEADRDLVARLELVAADQAALEACGFTVLGDLIGDGATASRSSSSAPSSMPPARSARPRASLAARTRPQSRSVRSAPTSCSRRSAGGKPGSPSPRCPPEDVGGPWGYGEFLEAIADPSHERHRELKEWFADDFNPHVVDIDWLSEDVTDLAQRWSRQPAVKRRRTA